jgi:hypothetical protein
MLISGIVYGAAAEESKSGSSRKGAGFFPTI